MKINEAEGIMTERAGGDELVEGRRRILCGKF